jgi:DNA-binding PadR family transcriptional regulator
MRAKLSYSAVAILQAIAQGRRYGFDIIDHTELTSATVYPTLGKLEDAGYVTGTWETHANALKSKRPPRRYYELRQAGRRALSENLERFRALHALPAKAVGR